MYCINCGVKLADSEKHCPLCRTPVYHPQRPQPAGQPLYPTHRDPDPQLRSRVALTVITTMLLIAMLTTLFTDLMINRAVTWSGYVAGGIIVGYVMLVMPFLLPKGKERRYIACLFSVIALYLHYISYMSGGSWFWSFALPVTAYLGALTFALAVLFRRYGDRALYIAGGGLIALGGFMPLLEYLIYTAFQRERFAAWSVYPLISLVLLGGMFIFLGYNTKARETMERKFFV